VQPKYAFELRDAHLPANATALVLVEGADHSNVPETFGLDKYRAALMTYIDDQIPR
jgi:hypothetical protein